METNKMQLSKKLMLEFQTKFGFVAPIDVALTPFVCYYALDIVALNEKLQAPPGTSTKEYIKQKYGQKALQIVKRWLEL